MNMLIPVTHILPLAQIRRQRFLPVAGTVLVRAGQEVRADEVIARADINPEHISLNIERGLGVPKNRVADYLKRSIGDDIPEGGVIASRSGVIAREVRAPRAGKLVAVGGGQVLLQVSNKPFELLAGIPGTVLEVKADSGAIIQTAGAWIQGVWGNGRLGVGALHTLPQGSNRPLSPEQLDPTLTGKILLAGYCGEQRALEQGAEFQLKGLIVGSLATKLLPIAARTPYPIMVIDGFGKIPMNTAADKLLSSNVKREITLNAMTFDHLMGDRPEIIIPLPNVENPPMPINIRQVKTSDRVRILRAPFQGAVGTVNAILPGLTRFASGLQVKATEVLLEDGEKAVVPLANIEVLG
jgi:hypothetical protein